MKPIIQAIVLFVITSTSAQNNILEFKNKIYTCENKWITYPLKDKETSYLLGYVYIDRQAGFTFHLEKRFTISNEGKFIPEAKDNVSRIIARISNFNTVCAVIPKEKFAELGITETPDFMKSYIRSNEAEDLVSRGLHYNHIGASFMAIPLLEKAQKINPSTKGLLFELAYAYNDSENYKKAIELLHTGITEGETNPLLYKELIYALAKEGQLVEAADAFTKMKKIKDAQYLEEAAYCIMQGYYVKKDAEKFEEWAKETMSLITSTESPILKNMDLMRKELKQ
ncbi:tetratricopeptide repeat protein [Flavobacterium sp. GCM10023249]|uniref:tetratricopeptide repeat protein n=1 Tax=unclassified Flavobacterium TaxID=196869 RepID=UPI00360CA764